MCRLYSCDRNGFEGERAKYVSPFGDFHDKKRNWDWMEKEYPCVLCVCVEGSAAPGSDVAVVRGWGEERVFTDVVILSCDRQDHSISRRWAGLSSATRTSLYFRGEGGGVSRAKSDQLTPFSPVPRLSEMKMILCVSEQSDGDSGGGGGEQRRTQRERKRRLEVEPALRRLKGKASLTGR